jgi:methanogenic corrinoid protein MtbC1
MTTNGKTQADIAVLQEKLNHVHSLVERNHKDAEIAKSELKASIEAMAKSLEALKVDLNERKGAEKLASAIRMTFAGTIGAAVVKMLAWAGSVPIK